MISMKLTLYINHHSSLYIIIYFLSNVYKNITIIIIENLKRSDRGVPKGFINY